MSHRICFGDKVVICHKGTNIEQGYGYVRFIGPILGDIDSNKHTFIGVELMKGNGSNDGSKNGISYFTTRKTAKTKKAIFIQQDRIKAIKKTKSSLKFTVGDLIYCKKIKNVALLKQTVGTIQFVGIPSFRKIKKPVFGIKLKEPNGDNNGTLKGVRYFKAKKNYGTYCSTEKVSKCFTPTEALNYIKNGMPRKQQLMLLVSAYLKQFNNHNHHSNSIANIIVYYMNNTNYIQIHCHSNVSISWLKGFQTKRLNLQTLQKRFCAKQYEFDTTYCRHCEAIHSLEFDKYYEAEPVRTDRIYDTDCYIHNVYLDKYYVQQYKCRKCLFYSSHFLMVRKLKTNKSYELTVFSPFDFHQPHGHLENIMNGSIVYVKENLRRKKQCDICKNQMKCIQESQTLMDSRHADGIIYNAKWWCLTCQLFCYVHEDDWYQSQSQYF